MVAHKGLVCILIGLSIIYRNNVVYCTETGKKAESGSSDPSDTALTSPLPESDSNSTYVPEPVVDETLVETPVELEPEEPEPEPLPEVNGLKIVDLDIVNFENNHHVNHRFDRARNMHIFSCGSGHAFGLIKESFGPQELQYLPQDELYKSLTQLKSKNLLHLHTDNMVGGAYRWNDTFAFMDHLKNGTLELTLQEESLFVTVEVDKMEANAYLNYGFDNDNNLHIFAANSPFIIDSVKLDGQFVWVYDDDRNDKKFPVSVEFNGSDMIKMKFDKFFLTYTRNDQNEWTVESDLDDISEDDNSLQFVTVDVDKMEATNYVDYAYDEDENVRVFAARKPLLINSITIHGEPIWKYDVDENDGNFPFSVEYNGSNEINVGFKEFFLSFKKDNQGQWAGEKHLYENDDILEDDAEVDQQLALPEGEAVSEPVLDDHVVAALEFVWRQNPAALEVDAPKKPVYAESVYVQTKDNEKTLTIFFTDRTVKRFHRIGHLGPWRERVTRPKVRAVATHPRAQFEKTLEMFKSIQPSQATSEHRKGVFLRHSSSPESKDQRDTKTYGRDLLAQMYTHNTKPAGEQETTPGQGANEGSTKVSSGDGSGPSSGAGTQARTGSGNNESYGSGSTSGGQSGGGDGTTETKGGDCTGTSPNGTSGGGTTHSKKSSDPSSGGGGSPPSGGQGGSTGTGRGTHSSGGGTGTKPASGGGTGTGSNAKKN